MDPQLKQRLVGAVVLVSLGVIFIPALLDGSGYRSRHERSIEIPEEPKYPPLTQLKVEKVKTPVEIRKEKAKQEAKQSISQTEAETVKKAIKKKAAEPVQSWALQVATFGERSNALVLQDKLRADKHPAYITETSIDGKQKFKVRIGPVVDKKRADKLKKTILATHDLEGYVVRHP